MGKGLESEKQAPIGKRRIGTKERIEERAARKSRETRRDLEGGASRVGCKENREGQKETRGATACRGAEARRSTPVCWGQREGLRECRSGEQKGARERAMRGERQKKEGKGGILHSGLSDHLSGRSWGEHTVRVPSGIPSTDSRRSLLFLPPGCSLTHLTHPPHPPDPEGRIFYLLLLSSAPSSPSSSPDQAALSWRWGLLHLPLITPPPPSLSMLLDKGELGP